MNKFLLLLVVVLFACTPAMTNGYQPVTSQSPARPAKKGETVTFNFSFQLPNRSQPETGFIGAPETPSELLENYTVKAYVCGRCGFNTPRLSEVDLSSYGYPYKHPQQILEGQRLEFPKSSNPVDYPFPPEADLIEPAMNSDRIPELADVTINKTTNFLQSKYVVKIVGDGKNVPSPGVGEGYFVWVQVGFVAFPKNIPATKENWDKAFIIAFTWEKSIRVEY